MGDRELGRGLKALTGPVGLGEIELGGVGGGGGVEGGGGATVLWATEGSLCSHRTRQCLGQWRPARVEPFSRSACSSCRSSRTHVKDPVVHNYQSSVVSVTESRKGLECTVPSDRRINVLLYS